MTTALGDDAEAAPARLEDGRDDALLVGGDGDGGRPLVDGEVERPPGRIPARVPGLEDHEVRVDRGALRAGDHGRSIYLRGCPVIEGTPKR